MKFGPLEGTSEEIKNFFQDNGLRAADYITLPDEPIKPVWFVVPIVVFIVALAVLTFFPSLPKPSITFVFLVGCAAGMWLAVNTQLRFKSPWATGTLVLGCLLLMLVALGAVTPIGLLDEVRSLSECITSASKPFTSFTRPCKSYALAPALYARR